MLDAALIAELREVVSRIALISHVSGTSYDGKMARDTSESVGGRRPSGSDLEPRPRRPSRPLIEGDAGSEKAWSEFEEELMAWMACYQRRTPEYFRRQLARCYSDAGVRRLIVEARETLVAWKRTPIPAGQEPEYGSPQWKRYIAESTLPAAILAGRFWNPSTGRPISPRYINKVRKAYRDAA